MQPWMGALEDNLEVLLQGDSSAGEWGRSASADLVRKGTYKTEATHQGYIEPHACVGQLGADGKGEMWVCTQGHFVYRNHCAMLLGMDVSKLRVTSSEIGASVASVRADAMLSWLYSSTCRSILRPVTLSPACTAMVASRANGPSSPPASSASEAARS